MKYIVALLVLLFTAVIVVNAQNKKKNSINIDDFISLMQSDSSLVILDVRTPPELEGPLGHIKGAINIPVQELEGRMNQLDKYKDKDIAVICRTGHRSGIATKMLRNAGFNATNVKGGMTAYRQKEPLK